MKVGLNFKKKKKKKQAFDERRCELVFEQDQARNIIKDNHLFKRK